MQCIYFGNDEKCYADPSLPATAGTYKPDDVAKKQFCKTNNFRSCPRFMAMIAYLEASKGK